MILRVLVAFICALCLVAEPAYSADDQPRKAIIKTNLGDLILQLDWQHAPQSCATFVRYVKDGVYAQTSFDEADEKAFFGGKPSKPIPGVASNGNMACNTGPAGEFALPNKRGFVGFRRTVGDCNPSKRSNCTQLYVRFKDNPASDGQFTIFAAVQGDLKLLDTIYNKLEKKESVPFSVTLE